MSQVRLSIPFVGGITVVMEQAEFNSKCASAKTKTRNFLSAGWKQTKRLSLASASAAVASAKAAKQGFTEKYNASTSK